MLYFFVKTQIESLDIIDYIKCHAICCDLTCDWVSKLATLNQMIDYVSNQLVSLLDSN